MSGLFTSQRERRIWAWVAITQLLIWSTLGLAPGVASYLRERNLLRLSLAAALGVAGLAGLVWWLRRRPRWAEVIAVGFVLSIFALAVLRGWLAPTDVNIEERTHLIEYSVVAGLVYMALRERRTNGCRMTWPGVWAFMTTVLLGGFDELIQWFLPNRVFDWVDIVFNTIAAALGVSVVWSVTAVVGWVRTWDDG